MDQIFQEAVFSRIMDNITKFSPNPQVVRGWHCVVFPLRLTAHSQKPPSGTPIPQRAYDQGTPIPDGAIAQRIMFTIVNGMSFPAMLALAGNFDRLVDGNSQVFTAQNRVVNLRIEVSD